MNNVIKKCKFCGEDFEAKNNKKKFCSTSCKNKYHYREKNPLEVRPCEICGKMFKVAHNNQRCCCKQCSKELYKFTKRDYQQEYMRKRRRKLFFRGKFNNEYLGSLGTNNRKGAIRDKEGNIDFERELRTIRAEKWKLGLY